MRSVTCAVIAIVSWAHFLHAGPRSSSNYSIPSESYGPAGARGASASYQAEGALGEIGALASSSSYVTKAGFSGQGYSVVGLVLEATPASIDEGQTRQLNAFDLLDDGTTLAPLDPSTVAWSIVSGPISISLSGVATAATVFQNTSAVIGGSAHGVSGQVALTILNIGIDDYQDYAADGIDDAWQVQYFGENNPSAAPQVDHDGDGEDNLSEFRSGSNPSDGNSVFRSARQLNISTRLRVLKGENVLIGGFIITGTQPKKVILRAIAPSLSGFVPGTLNDPTLDLRDSAGAPVAFNDNWKDSQQAEIEATGIPPSHDLESAIVQTLAPAAYTAILRGNGDAVGVAVVEAYDLDSGVSRLANIATRGFVDTGDNVMIGGFIVGGGLGVGGAGSEKVLIRAIGPSLASVGISGALPNPTLELYNSNGAVLAFNDNWKDSQQAEIEATGIPPTNDLESALVRIIPAGAYTAILRGTDGSTGVAVVEAYNLE